MKITIYRNGNDGGLSIEDGESAADVTRVIMQSAVSFVVPHEAIIVATDSVANTFVSFISELFFNVINKHITKNIIKLL